MTPSHHQATPRSRCAANRNRTAPGGRSPSCFSRWDCCLRSPNFRLNIGPTDSFPVPIGPRQRPTSTARGPTAFPPREKGSSLFRGGGTSRKSGGRSTPPDKSPSIRILRGWRPKRNGRADRRGPRHFPRSGHPPHRPDCLCTMGLDASIVWSLIRAILLGGLLAHRVEACGRHWIQATIGPCSAHRTGPEWGCRTWPFTRRIPGMCSWPQAMRISAVPTGWA